MGSTLKVDNIVGTSGTSAPITLSGDAATLGSGVTFPAGHIIQLNQTVDQSNTTRTGTKTSYASTGVSVTLANELQTNSKLFVYFIAYTGESAHTGWGNAHVLTIFQNGTNVCGNQLSDLDADLGLSNAMSGDGQTNNQYWVGTHVGSVLFTPTGTATAKKSVELYWKQNSGQTNTQTLNSAGNVSTGRSGGATVLTLMEIAQ